MATSTSRVNLFINDTQAQEAYKKHGDTIKQLRDGYEKLERGTDEWLKRTEGIKSAEKDFAKFLKEVDLTSLSIKELTALQAQLNNKVRGMNPKDSGFNEMNEALGKVRSRYTEVNTEIKGVGSGTANLAKNTEGFLGKAANGFNKYFGVLTAGAAAFTGIIFSAKKMLDLANEYEDRLANLSSLTGLVGEDLNWLSDQATEMSQSVVNGNIHITKSAKDIVDAYTIVGSQRPELLKNKEALQEVTKEALILAEAAKIDLVDAARAVTTSMNQFGLEADQSNRIINVLGAGSKEGAADISYLNEAMEKSGTAGKAANVSFEQQVALIETLGPKFSSAEMAGTQLKNVLLKMQGMKDEFNPAIVGMQSALDNMAKSQLNVTQLTKMFGQENIIAIQTLIEGKEQYASFERAVTGTSVAEQQAATNTATRKAALQQATNELENHARVLGVSLAPVATMSVNIFTSLVKTLTNLPRIVKENQGLIIALAGATLIYYNRLITVTIAEKASAGWLALKNMYFATQRVLVLATAAAYNLFTGNIGRSTAALRVMGASFLATPFGLVIIGIMGIIGALKLYDANSERTNNINRIKASLNKDIAEGTERLKQLQEEYNDVTARWNTLSVEEQKNMRQTLLLKLEAAKADLKTDKSNRDKLAVTATSVSTMDMLWNNFISGGNAASFAINNVTTAIKNSKEATDPLDTKLKEMTDTIKNLNGELGNMKTATEMESDAQKISSDTIAGMQAKVQAYQKAMNAAKIGSADYVRIQKELSVATASLNKHLSSAGDDNKKANDQAKKDYEALVKDLKKIDEDLEMAKLSTHDKELKEIELKYAELRKRAKGHAKEMLQINKMEAEANLSVIDKIIAEEAAKGREIEKKAAEDEKKAVADQNALDATALQNLYKEIEATDALAVMKAEGSKDEKAIYDAKVIQISNKMDQELAAVKGQVEQENLIRAKGQAEIDALSKASKEKRKAWEKEVTMAAIDAAGTIASAIASINQANRDDENSRKLSALQSAKEKELSAKKLTETQKAAIEKKYHDQEVVIKKAAWQRQQKADVDQALINGALAIVKTFASYGFTPAGLLAAGGQAIATGAQVAVIKSKPIPEFSSGGYTGAGYGIPDSSGHKPAGVVHAHEYVSPKWMTQSPRLVPVFNMLEAIRTRGYAAGGTVQPLASPGSNSNTGVVSIASGDNKVNEMILQALTNLNNQLASGINARALIGDQAIRDINSRSNEMSKVAMESV